MQRTPHAHTSRSQVRINYHSYMSVCMCVRGLNPHWPQHFGMNSCSAGTCLSAMYAIFQAFIVWFDMHFIVRIRARKPVRNTQFRGDLVGLCPENESLPWY